MIKSKNYSKNKFNEEKSLQLDITLNSKLNIKFPLFLISERLKKGFATIIDLRQGLKLVINDYQPKKKVQVKFKVEHPPLQFAYCLSGKAESTIKNDELGGEKIKFSKGMNTVFYFPTTKGTITIYPDEKIKILSLHISPEFLKLFVEENFDELPHELKNILIGKRQNIFILNNEITPSMHIALTQIFNTEYKGATKKMLLESKALELMTLQIQQMSDANNIDEIFTINQSDKNKILEITELLNINFKSPLSLTELSESVGMSHTKLNFAFKKINGATVFEYIRKLRLEYSRQLLSEGDMSITEISYEAGWSSPSHFSKEFLKHYGINPKKYQKDLLT